MQQIKSFTTAQVNRLHDARKRGPVVGHARFLTGGQAIQIGSGRLCSKGSNVIYHPVYWDCTQQFIDLALECLKVRNPGLSFRVELERI